MNAETGSKLLFSSVHIGNLELKNRFVRSATYDGGADRKGRVTPWQVRLIASLARGGVGLVVTGLLSVHESGRVSGYQNIISDDSVVTGLRRLVDAAHENGAKIGAQLAHCGREAHIYQTYKGNTALAPSLLPEEPFSIHPHRELSHREIREIVQSYGDAAARAKTAGFDTVQVHGAHAYLVSQFLSPTTNRRSDEWGGSFDARFHFIEEVYQAIRQRVGEAFPVMIKLGVADGFTGGLTFEAGKIVARRCMDLGFDAVEVSQGLRGKYYAETEFRTGISKREDEAYFRRWASDIRKSATAPVIMVGGIRSVETAREVVESRDADLVALSRPLIREPDLVLRWQRGERSPSRCISCNRCFELLFKGEQLYCVMEMKSNGRVGSS